MGYCYACLLPPTGPAAKYWVWSLLCCGLRASHNKIGVLVPDFLRLIEEFSLSSGFPREWLALRLVSVSAGLRLSGPSVGTLFVFCFVFYLKFWKEVLGGGTLLMQLNSFRERLLRGSAFQVASSPAVLD